MRAKRAKTYRKLMKQYALSFNFREPYQVLLDAYIVKAAARFKMHLGKLLSHTLHGEIKPMITQCCIRHLYNITTTNPTEQAEKDAWIEVAKAAERRRCGHHELEEPLSALECISSVVDPKGSGTNKNRYVVASQDTEIRSRMRDVAGVPLIYISRSVMILEPMAGKTSEVMEREERGKVRAGLKGRRGAQVGEKRKREEDEDSNDLPAAATTPVDGHDQPAPKRRKPRGPKGPNPLSVKKAKKEKPKPITREVEDERAVIRKAEKQDPQAAEKAMDAGLATGGTAVDPVAEGARKRKRKRKPQPSADGSAASVVTAEEL